VSDGLKILLGALGGAILVLLFVSTLGGGGMLGGGLLGMLFGLVFWVLVTALIIALVVWIVNQTQRR
jgi:hypothetical protein